MKPTTRTRAGHGVVRDGEARDGPGGAGNRPVVALTQSPGRLEGLRELLEAHGYRVLRWPLVTTVPRLDEATRAQAEELLALPWLLLTSRSTVEALAALGFDFARPQIGVIGPGTASALEQAGGSAAFVARRHDSRGLVEAFTSHPLASGPVGLPRGSRALLDTQESLERLGFTTRPLTVYDTNQGTWADEPVDAIVVASPSAVDALPDAPAGSPRLVAIGATTRRAAQERGFTCEQAAEATAQAIAQAIVRAVERGTR